MSLTDKHACENYGRHNVQRVPEVHRRWEGTWKYCKSQVSSSNLQSTKKMASKELGCVGGNPMHKEGAWLAEDKLWICETGSLRWMSCRGLQAWQEAVKNYVTQAHVVNSFHQLSLCSRRIWEFFFICMFTMVCFFNDTYKGYDHTHSFYLVFKMFVCGFSAIVIIYYTRCITASEN